CCVCNATLFSARRYQKCNGPPHPPEVLQNVAFVRVRKECFRFGVTLDQEPGAESQEPVRLAFSPLFMENDSHGTDRTRSSLLLSARLAGFPDVPGRHVQRARR